MLRVIHHILVGAAARAGRQPLLTVLLAEARLHLGLVEVEVAR
jgi:hypothetical protein